MRISVIIPTYKGKKRVVNALQSLCMQQRLPDEVIVSIDGDDDGSMAVSEAYKNQFETLRIIVGPHVGRAGVRNRGAAAATGDVLFFLDDDMRLAPDVISLHEVHHLKYSDCILVGNQIEEEAFCRTDIQKYKAALSRKWAGQVAMYTDTPLPKDKPFITAAHCSMPKSVFESLSGFDDRLTDAEDFDLAVRASGIGISINFNVTAIGWHDDFISAKRYILRQREYTGAQQRLRTLKPELYAGNKQYMPPQTSLFKKIAYSLVSNKLFVWLIDADFFTFIPFKQLRYLLYDIVITGLGKIYTQRSL